MRQRFGRNLHPPQSDLRQRMRPCCNGDCAASVAPTLVAMRRHRPYRDASRRLISRGRRTIPADQMEDSVTSAIQERDDTTSATSIERGRVSYSWRFGQDRRLEMVRRFVPLEGARILDIGCGIGTYVKRFRQYSDDVYGVDVEPERVAEASETLPNIQVARGEELPFPDDWFDLVFSNEVIEHVDDDRQTIREAVRVTKPGGYIVIFAPNRLWPFETHGAYFGKRYVFGNIPLINWLPDPLRNRFAPHVRVVHGDGHPLALPRPARAPGPSPGHLPRLRQHGRPPPRDRRRATEWPLPRRADAPPPFGLSHFLVVRKLEA